MCPLTGAALVALGAAVMAGWVLREPALVQVVVGAIATVFNTALSFVLAGFALIALDSTRPRIAIALAAAVLGVAAITQAQQLFGVDFGTDWRSLHAWIDDGNPRFGRTSVPASLGFALFGAAVILAVRGGPGPAGLPRTLCWLLVALAALNLAAYLFQFDDLFVALRFPRTGVLTSAGELVLGLAFLSSRRVRALESHDDTAARERITFTAALLLVSISGVAGVATLAVMEERMRAALGESLLGRLLGRGDLLEYIVSDAERTAKAVAGAPGIVRNMREMIATRRVLEANLEFMRAVARNFVDDGLSAVAIRDPAGQVLIHAGLPASAPALEVVLNTPQRSVLLWDGRMLLRTEVEMRDAGGIVGSALVEQPLPDFTLLSGDHAHLGETGEIGLCARRGERLRCFPTRLNPRVFETALESAAGKPLPMTLATDGKSGVLRTVDYRRKTVIAAHAPVGALGLGMVFKMDTAEIYAPIRDRILLGAALLLALVMAGTLLLRSRIRPLVARLVRAENAARESAERLKGIADNLPVLIGQIDTERRFRFNNRTYEDWYGMKAEQLAGRPVREVWGEQQYAALQPHLDRALAGERTSFEFTIATPGHERHVHATFMPDRASDGRVRGAFALGSDVSSLIEARRRIDRAKQRLELALEGSSSALWDTDLVTREVVLSERWAEMIGEPPGETRTTLEELMALVHPDDVQNALAGSLRAQSGEVSEYAEEHRVRTRDGGWIWILSRGKVVERDPASGRALRMAGTNVDITVNKLLQQRLQQLAHYDTLTGAANRSLFEDRLQRGMARARRSGASIALLYLDIDRFKPVNDRLGHAAGDALLKEFAIRLRACVRETDTVGRLGGDEFAVLLEDVRDAAGAERVAQKIVDAMREPVLAGSVELTVTTSIGIAMLRGASAEDADALARRADAALYEAKAAGRNTFRVSNAPA